MGHDHDDMIWRDEAIELVLDRRRRTLLGREGSSVPLDSIGGRSLAEPIVAEKDVPSNDFATMDGFAFDGTEEYPFAIVEEEEVFPEDKPSALEPGTAVRIATGAPLPEGANTVLKREDSSVDDGRLWGEPVESGTYVYRRGTNVKAGERLFETGERLSPKDTILLGDLSYEVVPVHDPFSIGVLATGTEIHEGRTEDLDSSMLAGLVRSWGHDATYEGTVPDEYDRVESAIDRLADEYDVVLTTGGTSVGHKDYVIRALESLGEVEFHRVRIRPGKPIAMAILPDHGAIAFAIPGKPIGAHTISTLVMRPFFVGDAPLPTLDAELARDVGLGPDGFEYVIPVTLAERGDALKAMPLGHTDSALSVYDETFDPSVLSSSTRASRADGVVITTSDLRAGEIVSVVPYPVLE